VSNLLFKSIKKKIILMIKLLLNKVKKQEFNNTF